jgi:uncharacterized protein YjbI with pentapeptide repeats
VFDVFNVDTYCQQHSVPGTEPGTGSASFEYILNQIAALGAGSFSNVGIVQHNTGASFHRFFSNTQGEVSTVTAVETADPTLQTWAGFAAFVTTLKNTYGVQNVDLMACALYSNPDWKYVIDTLTAQTAVTIRASTDDTGAAALGGDWFLESHTGINLKDVYFTEAIENVTVKLVSKIASTLGALTIPAKMLGDPPFVLTAPTSTVSSIISPTHTITSTASVMIRPPDMLNTTYGNWTQRGNSIDGETRLNYANTVSISADGTVVAIGAWGNDGTSGNTSDDRGHVRVYKYNPNKTYNVTDQTQSNFGPVGWDRLGQDIDGEAAGDWSGIYVSLSSDGTVVAIGAPYNDGTSDGDNRGHVRIYAWNGSSWIQRGNDIDGESVNDAASILSLSSNGRIVAIGGTYVPGDSRGYVRVYSWNDISWNKLGSNIVGEAPGDRVDSVDISTDGTVVAIGTKTNDATTGDVNDNRGHVRIYAWNGSSWIQRGSDIDGEAPGDESGSTVSISADGTVVAIGASGNRGPNNQTLRGHVRVYAWNDISWNQLGSDIDGETAWDRFGYCVSLSADGSILAISAPDKNINELYTSGLVRIYSWNGISWIKIGQDIYGEYGGDQSGLSIALSANGSVVAIGTNAILANTGNDSDIRGRVRVYQIATTNAITYSSSNSSVADVCGNILLIKGVNGTSTITASQTGNTVTGRLDVSGTTYTLQYNPFTYTISDASLATVSTYGTVTLTGAVGTSTITATQPETLSYASRSVTGSLVVSKNASTLGALTIPAKMLGDPPFVLTAPTSTISSIISPTHTITSTASVIVPPPDIRDISYGTTWLQRGQDIDGEAAGDFSGTSVSMSADGKTLAIGALYNDGTGATTDNRGHVRVYDLSGNTWVQRGDDIDGEAAGNESGSKHGVSLSANGSVVAIAARRNNGNGSLSGHVRVYAWNGISWAKRGDDIDGEAANDYSGESVSISADGTVVAIGATDNDGSGNLLPESGHVRVRAWNGISWVPRGNDIDGEAANDWSGRSVSISADGTVVAIGAILNDGTTGNTSDNRGHVRVYAWNGISWNKRGDDIDGEAAGDYSGVSVSISSDGSIVAIGASANDGSGNLLPNSGHVRVRAWNGISWVPRGDDIDGEAAGDESGISVSISADGSILAIGAYYNDGTVANSDRGHVRIYAWNGISWVKRGQDIDGETASDQSGFSVSLSADGTRVAIGAQYNDGTVTNSNRGHVRVYDISVNNALTYSSSNSSVADVCGNILLIKGVNGTSTITASQTGNTVTGRLDVSGTTYTLQYNPFTYTISDASLATVSTYGTVTLTGALGTSTITATQPETLSYASRSVTGSLVVSKNASTLGTLTIPAKMLGDPPFVLTAPTSTVSSIISPTHTITSTASVIIPPPDIRDISYGATWTQRGGDIDGEAAGDNSYSVRMSADGTVVAIGAYGNDGTISNTADDGRGHVRVYKYNPNKTTPVTDQSLSNFGPAGWDRLGGDIDGEAYADQSGEYVALSADGTVIAIASPANDGTTGNIYDNRGHVRVYKYTPGKPEVTNQNDPSFGPVGWTRLGADIDGEAEGDGANSVSLSADGTIVAIGSQNNDGSGNLLLNSGSVRVYKYTPGKPEVTNQNDLSFGPVGWTRLGADIDGEATADFSGYWNVCLSADGTTVAIGAHGNDGTTGNPYDIRGHVRVYKYDANKLNPQLTQGVPNFGPRGWNRLGEDIDGEAPGDKSGQSVALSADGTIVAIGALWNDGTTSNTDDNRGHVRVYKYNPNKTVDVSNQSLSNFGPAGWDRLGGDIDGEAASDYSGMVSLSADGTILAIGAFGNDGSGNLFPEIGHVRIYRYTPNKTVNITNQNDASFGPVGWTRLGLDIDGEASGNGSGVSVSLSSDGTTVAIGANGNDGTTGNTGDNRGHVRVYQIATTNALTYSSSNSSVADVCGNLLLIKGVNGTSTITASQTGNTVTGRLDVSGTTYTLQYNPFTYTISDASLATVSTYGTVTLTGAVGTSTITATQPETLSYSSRSVTGTLDVSGIETVLGALTIPTKMLGDASFNITPPTSNNPSGAFTYTSSNTSVATVTSGGIVTIVGIGTSTITAAQAGSGLYSSASVSGSLVVNFGNTTAITRLPTDGASVIPTPVSNVTTTYGSTWNQLGADTVGKVSGDESGTSVSVSADGTIVAIGARSNSTNRGTTRVYRYNDVSWVQMGTDINGEASSDYSGQSVSLSANGRIIAIGANMNDGSGNLLPDSGHVRIYEFNGTNWVQRGGDIDGEANDDQSGISVSLSADGSTVAIGAIMNDGSGNALSNSGHVRVYRYNASKTIPQITNQNLSTFGPAGWDRLGGDIDGEAVNDQSGFSVSLSVDGSIVAIGAIFNDGTSGTVDTSNNRGHVRVYRYNASKTSPQLTNQTLSTFGPASWDRLGADIDGEAAADQSGFSVSLSADGTTVAIGSPLFDASGGSNSGRVRVFAWNGSSWAQRGQNINGVMLDENVGDSVSLSADGSILSVASFMKVVNYNYNSSTNTWIQIGANVTGTSTTSTSNIANALTYTPHIYLDATNTNSYNGSTWTNIGSLGGNVVMTNMGTFDANDNGGSFNFNGSNYGQINITSTTLTSFTYLAVVKTSGLNTGWATIIDFGNDNLLFATYNNVLQLYNPHVNTGFTLTANVWYVFALTVSSGGAVTFYVNGVSIYSTTITPISRTNNAWGIGAGITASEPWNGKISAIAIFHNRVLTASEITNINNTFQTYRVSLSSQGNILAIGAREYDGATGSSTNIGLTRVYRIDTSGNYTYSSNNTTVADVCGNIILPKSIGSTTIAFTQSASGATASRSGTIAFAVSAITPTLGAFTVPAKILGDASFNLTAPTSNSTGAFTYDSSNVAVATVTSGGTVTIVGVGTTTITATQAATDNYAAGTITATLVVTASLSNFTVPSKNYGDASFNLVDPSSNDTTVGFTFASSNPSVATLGGNDGRTVTIMGVGSTVITATQAATATRGQLDISATLIVSPITPIITIAPITKAYGNQSFRPVITSTNTDTSGGSVFTFSSDNISIVSMLDASLVRINGVGTTTLRFTQAASANFTDASGSVSVTVAKGTSGFSASSFVVAANKTYGDASFAITTAPISSSTGAITYLSSDEAVATITNSGVITIVGQGTVSFTASQAESALYTADTKTSNTLTVARKTAALSRNTPSAATIDKNYGDATFSVSATNESNGAFSFSSSYPSFATIDASTGVVSIVAVGSTTLTATRGETDQYTATSVSWTLNIGRGTTTLVGLSSLTRNVTVAPFTVTATSASDGAVSYALQDPSSTVLTIHPTTGLVTLLSPGSAVIVASQAQGTLYEAPSSITATITVTAAANTLQGATLTGSNTFANVDLSGASLSNANITNTNFASGRLDNTNFNGATISGANMMSAELTRVSLANATVTNTNFSSGRLNNANINGANISNSNMSSAQLSESTMINATITGTNFTSAVLRRTDLSGANVRGSIFNNADLSGSTLTRLDASGASFINADLKGSIISNSNFTNSNMTNANISGTNLNGSIMAGANMSSAQLSGSTMTTATITGTNFTSAIMRGTNLSDANARSSIFNNADLSGSTLPRMDASGASFINADLRGANLSSADFTNANMTNANISGADITNVTFTSQQKLQLLKNTNNRLRSEIQVSQIVGSSLLPILSAGSAVRDVPNVANATFKVIVPATSLVVSDTISDLTLDIANFAYFYFPIGENEYFQIQGVKYYISGSNVRNATTGAIVENTSYGIKAIRLIAGSLTIIVNSQNTLPSSSFVVPSYKINTDAAFSPTTLPTSNSSAPIVYSSSNTSIATIHSSTGVITPVLGACGYVRFTASQVATETHESAFITSNELFVNHLIDLSLPGLNQTFTLSTLAALDASSVSIDNTDATAVFYVRLSDMTNLFQYQTDSFDINNVDASDIKYYVFHHLLPAGLQINPSHAMMNKNESTGMLGNTQGYTADKSLVKHDFIRYIAFRLFNTFHGVDLFKNEQELHENVTYLGETVRNNIDTILSNISTTSAVETMSYDASGNKYLTNDASGNTNLCRELMRQIAATYPSRFYNNGANTPGLRSVPLHEDDSINFKLTITSAPGQNIVTGVPVIPSRTYMIKMVIKNTVNTDTNTRVIDSEMYPNSYPYSASVVTYPPTEDSSGVYNVYSPPAPIPLSRFGYNGWYYTNTTTWVNVAPLVRDRVKWIVPANTVTSTIADLQYIRMNLKVFNKSSLPFILVTTQAGSYRKYTISAPNSLVNGTVYSFYMNFNTYTREPATIGATNAALSYSNIGSGSFANNEVVTSISVESDNTATTGSIEFTLANVVVGEVVGEKQYGFSARV